MPKPTIETTGMKTADSTVSNKPCYLRGACLYSNGGSSTMTLTIYDSGDTVTSGRKVLAKLKIDAGDHYASLNLGAPLRASLGLRCDVTGTSASYLTYYGSQAAEIA